MGFHDIRLDEAEKDKSARFSDIQNLFPFSRPP